MSTPLRDQPRIVLGLALLLVLAHVGRVLLPVAAEDALFWEFAILPARYDPGVDSYPNLAAALLPLIGHVFLHGGWLHLGMNVLVFLQAADVVLARMDTGHARGGSAGALRFLALFFGSAIGAAAAYIWINPHAQTPAVGASGAICGLFAAYLMAMRPNWRAAVNDPDVRRSAFWFLAVNVGLAAAARMSGVLPIAWEAHLGGFVAGALLYPWIAPRAPSARALSGDV